MQQALLLKADLSKVRFGFTDGRKVTWLAEGSSGGKSSLASLEGHLIDAVQVTGSDRIYLVTNSPHALVVFDPRDESLRSIPLDRPASSLDVSSDETRAVVGHDASVSSIDLISSQVTSVQTANLDILDIVLSQDQKKVYLFPKRDQWENLSQLDLINGEFQVDKGGSIYAGTVGKLHRFL